ncbi:MAG: NAD/NADP octopine/nopaline dehydrogenase family protein [Armatimonadota bacterium]
MSSEVRERPRFCVIGAGHGGLAMAGHLGFMGFDVHLHNRSEERIAPVKARGGVQLEGEVVGFGSTALATTNAEEAVTGCDVIMVVVPATAHRDVAKACAPHLSDGQIVVLNPGRTLGAIEFHQVLRSQGCKADVIVAEAQTLIYASRATGPGEARIFRIKNAIPVASVRAQLIPKVLEKLRIAFPQFVPGDNVLKTGLNNIGAVFHPAQMLLNAGWVESADDFEFYNQAASKSVSRVLQQLDRERVAVAAALGVRAMTAREWLYFAYGATGSDLPEAMAENPGYNGIRAPRRMNHRYITEDVPTSLVPIASLGHKFGRPTPIMDCIIGLASVMREEDYWATGRTVERLGLQDMSLRELLLLAIGEEPA